MNFFGWQSNNDDNNDRNNRCDSGCDRSYLDDLNTSNTFDRSCVSISIEGDEGYTFTNKKTPIIRNGHTYFPMNHRESYRIILKNNSPRRVNADVYVDGENVGKWRINGWNTISLERPANINRKFTFVKENSREAIMGDVTSDSTSNGLIEVKFVPEEERHQVMYMENVMYDTGNRTAQNAQNERSEAPHRSDMMFKNAIEEIYNFSSGATVLGNQSSQRYGTADSMIEDRSKIVIKRVRLIIDETSNKPFISIKTNRFHQPVIEEDPIPPRINKKQTDFRFYLFGNPNSHDGYYSDDRSF